MLSRPLVALVCALLLSACASPVDKQAHLYKRVDGLAPMYGLHHDDKIEGHYIVLFDANHSRDDHFAHLGQNLSYNENFVKLKYGYEAQLPDALLLTRIRTDAKVLAVKVDREITTPEFVATPMNETIPEVPQGPASSPIFKRGTRTYEKQKSYAFWESWEALPPADCSSFE